MAHDRGALGAAVIKDVVAVLVEHREMRVQTRAGVILVGFRHKARGKAVAAGKSLDQHLEQPRIIGGAQGIVTVHQVDFELAQTCF